MDYRIQDLEIENMINKKGLWEVLCIFSVGCTEEFSVTIL